MKYVQVYEDQMKPICVISNSFLSAGINQINRKTFCGETKLNFFVLTIKACQTNHKVKCLI